MTFYAMLALHAVDDITNIDKIESSLVMYPFESKKEMMEFKDKIDSIYRDDMDILDFAERDR
jgi:hypothetical protein